MEYRSVVSAIATASPLNCLQSVLPEYQEMGIGRLIMEQIEKYLQNNAPKGAFIGLMAAESTEEFYKKFGYAVRSKLAPGMFKYIN